VNAKRTDERRDVVSGVLLLDKPAGITSNGALQRAKRLIGARKAGHTGSLDPIATGLLPLCFGEATKISQFFLDADKRYRVRLRLGVTTRTGDAEGEVVQQREVKVTESDIEPALAGFRGEIDQVPPMYSALKRDGQPLYKLARQGIEVEREPRQLQVYELVAEHFAGNVLELRIHASHGFYVRALAHDLGERLGCGAHAEQLRRLAVGELKVEDAVSLEQLEALETPEQRRALLIRGDEALDHLPAVWLTDDAAFYLCRGEAVRASDSPRAGWVRLYGRSSGFLGLGKSLGDGRVTPKRLFHKVGAGAA